MENMDQILDAPVMAEKRMKYAGFWIRFGAYVVDAIILGVINVLLDLLVADVESQTIMSIISLFIGVAYFAVMESSERQATFGKMAVGIKVGDRNGEQISLLNAVGRYFAKIISALTLLIGFMMAGWDEKNQALHDKIADTYVFYP